MVTIVVGREVSRATRASGLRDCHMPQAEVRYPFHYVQILLTWTPPPPQHPRPRQARCHTHSIASHHSRQRHVHHSPRPVGKSSSLLPPLQRSFPSHKAYNTQCFTEKRILRSSHDIIHHGSTAERRTAQRAGQGRPIAQSWSRRRGQHQCAQRPGRRSRLLDADDQIRPLHDRARWSRFVCAGPFYARGPLTDM